MSKLIKSATLALLSAVTFGTIAPAMALENGDPACRQLVSTAGIKTFDAKGAQMVHDAPLYRNPSDFLSDNFVATAPIGSNIELAMPYEEQFFEVMGDSPSVIMVAVKAYGQKLWTPLAQGVAADGDTYQAVSRSTLGYCAVQGMW